MLLDGFTVFTAWFAVFYDTGLAEHHTVSLSMHC